jgi:hypothetical protein
MWGFLSSHLYTEHNRDRRALHITPDIHQRFFHLHLYEYQILVISPSQPLNGFRTA